MPVNEPTAGYAEIASEAYASAVDALEGANQRALDYAKSVWGIFARPSAVRASALVSVTLEALATNNRVAADLAREGARIVRSAQESYVASLRGVAEMGVSNLAFVKNAAARMQSQELQVPHFN